MTDARPTQKQIGELITKCRIKGNGNIKLGKKMGTISKLYGTDTYHVQLTKSLSEGVMGTCNGRCAGCEKACYVRKSYRYPSVILSHARTTHAMRIAMNDLFTAWDKQLSRMRIPFSFVRINQSGEIESKVEFLSYCWLAERHPKTKFYLYTKAYDFVIPSLLAGNVPNNLYVNISIWSVCGLREYESVRHLPNVHAFVYVDGEFTVAWYEKHGLHIDTFCHAYDEHGKLDHNVTCDKCRKCIDRKVEVIGCYGH